jgi:hypothetical protein
MVPSVDPKSIITISSTSPMNWHIDSGRQKPPVKVLRMKQQADKL